MLSLTDPATERFQFDLLLFGFTAAAAVCFYSTKGHAEEEDDDA